MISCRPLCPGSPAFATNTEHTVKSGVPPLVSSTTCTTRTKPSPRFEAAAPAVSPGRKSARRAAGGYVSYGIESSSDSPAFCWICANKLGPRRVSALSERATSAIYAFRRSSRSAGCAGGDGGLVSKAGCAKTAEADVPRSVPQRTSGEERALAACCGIRIMRRAIRIVQLVNQLQDHRRLLGWPI